MTIGIAFHPLMVHFSIALFTVGILLEWVGDLAKNEHWRIAGGINVVLSGVAVVFTVVSGLFARQNLQFLGTAQHILEIHQTLAFLVSSGVLGLVLWRIGRGKRMRKVERRWFLVLGAILLGGISLVGYQGGRLVFEAGLKDRQILVAPPKEAPQKRTIPGAEMYPEEK